ncbi:hypothetical protein [Pseudonocardia sp. HH130630-07]|uniref:hypothetical protein n=1 Tax=Pseudonocardia sp. HH130630-07 TaxID=1690815 RepID=UPI000814E838|nr:hypothetical protein [Pseudonocardia sp. HH130630-07]ANY08183.1 hypothetical protein AFB00_20000 [Pseudonocardia sp. HH130630-07]
MPGPSSTGRAAYTDIDSGVAIAMMRNRIVPDMSAVVDRILAGAGQDRGHTVRRGRMPGLRSESPDLKQVLLDLSVVEVELVQLAGE